MKGAENRTFLDEHRPIFAAAAMEAGMVVDAEIINYRTRENEQAV